jgi:hypothetical protein
MISNDTTDRLAVLSTFTKFQLFSFSAFVALPYPPKRRSFKFQYGKSSEFGRVKSIVFFGLRPTDNCGNPKSSVYRFGYALKRFMRRKNVLLFLSLNGKFWTLSLPHNRQPPLFESGILKLPLTNQRVTPHPPTYRFRLSQKLVWKPLFAHFVLSQPLRDFTTAHHRRTRPAKFCWKVQLWGSGVGLCCVWSSSNTFWRLWMWRSVMVAGLSWTVACIISYASPMCQKRSFAMQWSKVTYRLVTSPKYQVRFAHHQQTTWWQSFMIAIFLPQ